MIYYRLLTVFVIFIVVLMGMIEDVATVHNDDPSIEDANKSPSTPPPYQDNDSSSETGGPPDSHEAMNNRPIYNKKQEHQRDKRNFEFLLGLIHNNSRYEITKIDPGKPPQQQHPQQQIKKQHVKMSQGDDSKSSASELLLELMVKIAAHPDHWDKVHNLLQKIDNDLMASKKLIDNLQMAQMKIERTEENSIDIDKKFGIVKKNTTGEWPNFDRIDKNSNDEVSFVNTLPTEDRWQTTTQQQQQQQQPQQKHKSIYPKTFAYHRVTGRPLYLNKNPKAYIAVSVIAPKPINGHTNNEDLSLEKELRQLKPWTHDQNLKNMATLRSRWVIENDPHKTNIAP